MASRVIIATAVCAILFAIVLNAHESAARRDHHYRDRMEENRRKWRKWLNLPFWVKAKDLVKRKFFFMLIEAEMDQLFCNETVMTDERMEELAACEGELDVKYLIGTKLSMLSTRIISTIHSRS